MVRRLPLEEPPSRLAMWSLRLALFALAVALLSIILVRGSFVETIPGLAVLAGGLLIASVGLLTGLSAFFVIWRNGNPGFTRAIVGMAVSVALIAYPTLIVARTYHLPPIADVTTAPDDPPQFEVIARVRPRAANPVAYPAANAAMQREGYPEIAPLQYSATPADVFRAVVAAMKKDRSLLILDERAPQAGRRDGRVEAVARTMIMGFRDDVVVRIRGTRDGTTVDIRSASRYGERDFGSNAKRIRALAEAIEEEVGNQPAPATTR